MALFKGARTVVRTTGRDSESFEIFVGVHQGAVLNPLLFVLVMDVASKVIRYARTEKIR